MPASSVTRPPARRTAAASSEGRTNFRQSCVPRGNRPNTYSAPTMATAKALAVRLSVEKIAMPPGATVASVARAKA